MTENRSLPRLPVMGIAMIALLSGLWTGLLRLGWVLPAPRHDFGAIHGPLMISGFLGTLIGLERAVALGRRWAYVGPALTALGVLGLLSGALAVAPAALALGSVGLLIVFAVLIRVEPALHTITMGVGVLTWAIGNGRWLLGAEVPEAVSWWMAFLVLTIAGERLELSRLVARPRVSRPLFVAAIGLLLGGLLAGGLPSELGARWCGVGLVALGLWLARFDVARRTVHGTGLPRFTAVCLLTGYVWLAVAGALAIAFGSIVAGPRYDAVLHGVFLGFVFAMIFGHAPIIFPAVLGMPVPFRRAFYAHVVALHVSLAIRVVGDCVVWDPARQWGGMLNVAAVLLFLANTVRAVASEQLAARAPLPRDAASVKKGA